MGGKLQRLLVLIPWASLPLLVGGYLSAWGRLPARLAMHFDLAGRPNGWAGRGMFLGYAIFFLLLELSVFTGILSAGRSSPASPWLLAAYYFFAVGESVLLWQVVEFNLTGIGLRWARVAAAAAAAAVFPVIMLWVSGLLGNHR